MGSNFHYTIDLNEDQNHQPFFTPLGSSIHHNHHHQQQQHQAPFNISSSSSSLTSPSHSYLPFLINSHQDQVYVGYNNITFQRFLDPQLSQSLETKKFVSNDGSSSSDQMVPKQESRLKLTIRKRDNFQDQTDLPRCPTKDETETNSLKWVSSKVRLMKKKTILTTTYNDKQHVNQDQSMSQRNLEEAHHDHLKKTLKNQYNSIVKENGYNGSSSCVVRICSDCNTTKTPLWRSGPRGPKSLCNACGIRQRKARRAAAAATGTFDVSPLLMKKKMQNKNKRSSEVYNLVSPLAPKVKNCKRMITSEAVPVIKATTAGDLETQGRSENMSFSSSTCSSSNKFDFDDLAIILSKSSAYQQVFPQDEKEAAILLMALSYGMVHG
ncbi:hypothetical protein EUTSA_v10025461mg [Eutrema salsugineum]|uniref:GATA-type domain-containing protein n=1 Tax=Eutrema salsugineum TaxID=72664 RepID=V4ME04_EUTSA|nr:putative GATA transcription factor 22 [Eutrema salsugineum]ESQ54674.1 hypothetical protein EUTSA_v10025461mg [Eutrema salsugineum]